MILFLQHIPANTRPTELYDYISPIVTDGALQLDRILQADILIIQDKITNTLEYHGLVHLDSKATGLRALQALADPTLNEQAIAIREYSQRNPLNDRRRNDDEMQKPFIEQRQGDRRREQLEFIIDLSNVFNSFSSFIDNPLQNI